MVRRGDFLAANRGRRHATPGFVLLARPRDDDSGAVRVGFTVSRKVGNAVIRNRVKRRLRALSHELLPELAQPGTDLVLIARPGAGERGFGELRTDLGAALKRLRR